MNNRELLAVMKNLIKEDPKKYQLDVDWYPGDFFHINLNKKTRSFFSKTKESALLSLTMKPGSNKWIIVDHRKRK